MKITLRLSESLLSIYRETDNPLEEEIVVNIDKPAKLRSILSLVGINPLLAPMIIIDNKNVSLDLLIEKNETITLIGPLAGG